MCTEGYHKDSSLQKQTAVSEPCVPIIDKVHGGKVQMHLAFARMRPQVMAQ